MLLQELFSRSSSATPALPPITALLHRSLQSCGIPPVRCTVIYYMTAQRTAAISLYYRTSSTNSLPHWRLVTATSLYAVEQNSAAQRNVIALQERAVARCYCAVWRTS